METLHNAAAAALQAYRAIFTEACNRGMTLPSAQIEAYTITYLEDCDHRWRPGVDRSRS